jgi:hypothetical protein
MLAACMWSLNRFNRPAWTTSILIPLAFGCGIASGVLIWKGGKKTKRTERVEERLRRVLEMDESQHAIGSDGVMAKLQGALSRYNPESKLNGGSVTEKTVEPHHDTANAVGARSEPAGSRDASIRSPGIKIEEEMIIPPRG